MTKKPFKLILYVYFVFCFSALAYAQDRSYVYQEPTIQNLSKLYWALSKLDVNNDGHIDNYLRINECDVFKDYFHHEFEWYEVRKSARDHIIQNKRNFPLRFQFVQPLQLGEYNIEEEYFGIVDEFKIIGTRRFEMMSNFSEEKICNTKVTKISGYPTGLVVELSRPFTLDRLPMGRELAKEFISQKMKNFQQLKAFHQTQANLYYYRDIYMVMKVKIFAYQGEVKAEDGPRLAGVLGVLEGIDIYADREQEILLHSENFRKRKKKSALEKNLKAEYEAKKAKQEEAKTETGGE